MAHDAAARAIANLNRERAKHAERVGAILMNSSRSTELVVDVIAFDMSPEATASLACLATETGGTVKAVDDELRHVVSEMRRVMFSLKGVGLAARTHKPP